MQVLKLFWNLFQSIIWMGVVVLAIDYYDVTLIPYEIPALIEHMVIIGVLGVSLFWAILHVVGGGLFGLAASGVVDGLKMGLLLGMGLGISRLWSHCLAWAIGCFAADGPLWHMISLGFVALILLGLNSSMRYFWGSIQQGKLR